MKELEEVVYKKNVKEIRIQVRFILTIYEGKIVYALDNKQTHSRRR
jgi:hypothetical protein